MPTARPLDVGNSLIALSREAEADAVGRGGVPGRAAPPLGSRGGGSPLPDGLRRELEADTGADLSAVRVHRGAAASREARARRARAFAHGDDIVFAARAYDPDSVDGRDLITHEVGHVLQQRREGIARIDRDPDNSPQAVFEGAVGPIVLATMTKALNGKPAFWDVLIDEHQLSDKLIERAPSVTSDDEKAFRDAFDVVLAQISVPTAPIELADAAKNETVDWDSATKLLSKQLGSPALATYGLPTSFGTDLFVQFASQNITSYVIAMAQVLYDAYSAYDPNTATEPLAAALNEKIDASFTTYYQQFLTDELAYGVQTWGDPFGLLELELEGAMYALRDARGELAAAKDSDARAKAGQKIGYLARYIIAIDAHLVPADERKQRREQNERVEAIGATDSWPVSEIVANARSVAPDEEKTLQFRGNALSELTGHSAAVDSPLYQVSTGTQLQMGINQEEAYPHYTDQATLDALRTLANQLSAEVVEVERMRKQIVPDRVVDLVGFATVYKRWFGFYSNQARANDWSFQLIEQLYQGQIMTLAAMGGPEGWIGRGFLTQSVGMSVPVGYTNESFQSEVSRIKFTRQERTTGEVTSGGGASGVHYGTAELPTGATASLDIAGETSSRQGQVADLEQKTRSAFQVVYDQPDYTKMIMAAATLGLYHTAPDATEFLSRDKLHAERLGFDAGWSYLMDTEVLSPSGDFKTVHEHKVMRDEVAGYLVARAQALQSHSQPHYLRDEYGNFAGDPAAGKSGLEGASITAEARYVRGEPEGTTNSEAESLKDAIRAAKQTLEDNTPTKLVFDLQHAMDDFFAHADLATRALAVLFIAVYEDQLEEQMLAAWQPEAIAWAIGIATGIAVICWGLSKLGPLGMLASKALEAALHRAGISLGVATVLTIGQWALGASTSSSFTEAERWAYVGAAAGAELSQLMRDYALATGVKLLKFAWDWKFKPPPTDIKSFGNDLRNTLGNDPVGRQMLDDIEASIRQSLDAGDQALLTKESIEFLKAADPEAYARLVRDYPAQFKDVVAPRPDLRPDSPAFKMHAMVQGYVDPKIAGRVRVIEVPGNSVRIRAKGGMLTVEVGEHVDPGTVGAKILEGHLGSVQRLSRFVGPLGQVRMWIAKVGSAVGFRTSATKAGEAVEEITKLTDIRQRLEALRNESESKFERWARDPDSVTDAQIDEEIANINKQLEKYTLELADTSVGKGYIASEGNFAALEDAGVLGMPLDVDALEKLGYHVDKNGVIYRPRGGGASMLPLQVRNGVVVLSEYESPAAVQARVYEGLPPAKQAEFDAMQKTLPPKTKAKLVEGVYDTGVTWKEVFGDPRSAQGRARRAELKKILTGTAQGQAGLPEAEADRLINGLLDNPETIKVVLGTDPVRSAYEYRSPGTAADLEAHHFDPLYLGGGHDLIANLPSGAHDAVHRYFDNLKLPPSAPKYGGVRLQPGELQSAVRVEAKPAVVVVAPDGSVSYRLSGQDWKL